MHHAMRCVVAVVAAVVTCSGLEAQVLTGRILDSTDNTVVLGATVQLHDGVRDTVLAEMVAVDGRFELNARAAGSYRLHVEASGYATLVTRPIAVAARQVVTLDVRIAPDAIALEPLTVITQRIEPPFMADVRRRQYSGFGRLISREELDQRAGSRLEDVLASAGLPIHPFVVRDRSGRETNVVIPLVLGRAAGFNRNCYSSIYVDGVRIFSADDPTEDPLARVRQLFLERPADMEAIEIYRGAGEIPAEYGGSTSECGVVAIWMRRGYDPALGDATVPASPATVTSLRAGGAVYRPGGPHAPDAGTALEAGGALSVSRRVAVAVAVRYGEHTVPAPTMTYLLGPQQGTPPDVSPHPVTLFAAAVEPRVVLTDRYAVQPVVAARLMVLHRRLTARQHGMERSSTFTSSGWGTGLGAGVETRLSSRVRIEAGYAREWLRYSGYSTLEQWWRPTASRWSATALRLGVAVTLQ